VHAHGKDDACATALPRLPPLRDTLRDRPAVGTRVSVRLRVPHFDNRHVLVVGDVMLDRYWHGDSLRVSPEAPVQVVDIGSREERAGGAANVALNVAALGCACTLVGAIGDDEAGRQLTERLHAAGVSTDFVVVPGWATITKVRVIARRQQLIRLDFESPLPAGVAAAIAARAARHAPGCDAAVLSDYDKGVLASPQELLRGLGALRDRTVVDPKRKPLSAWRGALVVKPNQAEFEHHAGRCDGLDVLAERARAALPDAGIGALLVTRGEHGMLLVDAQQALHVAARPVDVFDVTGAGDTVAATVAACLAAGTSLADAVPLANLAAGIAVTRSGTVAITGAELRLAATADDRASHGVLAAGEAAVAVAAAHAAGERVVFTNGCFDVLHAGHVGYLEEARALGDRLLVAVNDDASVARLKGPGRPVNPLEQRLSVLAGLRAVDWVVPFAEDTPEPLLAALRPDVLVKGGDYAVDEVVGADIVRGYGGEVRVLRLVDDLSTSAIVARIRGS
jgi:D-beta-D-heptose 7-phosphate kinase/D-beta-D-heptose 1-phosphate adenosyltransferase